MGYNCYDHRLRNYVAETGDVQSLRNLVPMSTLRNWIKKGPKEDVVSLPSAISLFLTFEGYSHLLLILSYLVTRLPVVGAAQQKRALHVSGYRR